MAFWDHYAACGFQDVSGLAPRGGVPPPPRKLQQERTRLKDVVRPAPCDHVASFSLDIQGWDRG